MALNLKKPLIIFDLETTGVNVTHDRIVQLSYIKVMPDGSETSKSYMINPEVPIPAESTQVHHITDEMVKDMPTFRHVAKEIANVFKGSDIAGFNSNKFDIPLLDQEFQRADVDFDFTKVKFVDVLTIFHKKEPRDLKAAYKFYCDKELENAHNAVADTRATYEVLLAQLQRYPDLPEDIESLAKFSSQKNNVDFMGRLIYDEQGREVINFGVHKGKLAADVLLNNPGFYSWIMQGDFPKNTKDAFTRIKLNLRNK